MFKIQIPKPCHEDWNAMTPTQQGAFCGSCNKEVVDFTKMTDEEVQHYFLHKIAGKTCGHFRAEQIDHIRIILPENILLQKIAGWKKFMAVVMLAFGSMLFGCNVHTNDDVMGKPYTHVPDTNSKGKMLLGDTVCPTHPIETLIMGEVPAPPENPSPQVKGFTQPALIIDSTDVTGDISYSPIKPVEVLPTIQQLELVGIDSIPTKDTIIKKPASDTSKCKDTGYY